MESQPLSASALSEALQWGRLLGSDWALEFPAEDIDPSWEKELTLMLGDSFAQELRVRIHRVMRRLRRTSPRAYDVLFMMMIRGYSVDEVTDRLNERAARNGIDQTYTTKDTLALFVSGTAFCRAHW